MTDYKYKAFISYSHKDKGWARWLHRALESYRVPQRLVDAVPEATSLPRRLAPVFRDREDLASSADLTGRITDVLENSENLIVICSPAAAASPWVNQEIEAFKRLGRSNRVFSLIVEGDPTAVGTEQDCFPPVMRQAFDANGNPLETQVEPIGADVRKTADGPSLARQKIIAGMLGVGLDALRQRELLRRNRRMAVITAASLAGVIFTALLALNAYVARNEANQRRVQAEELLSFMVGDLRDSLEPIGRLDLLEKVGENAIRYFSTVDIDALTDGELLRQAQVLTQIGEIRVSEKDYEGALDSFTEAYARSAALFRNKRNDGNRLFERSQAEFWVGYVHWRRGNLDDARDWLTRYLESAVALAELAPDRDDWVMEVAYGHHNLAVLAMESGELEQAESGFAGELDVLNQIQKKNPTDENERHIADVISWLARVALMRGEYEAARENYAESAAMLEKLSMAEPRNRIRRYDWAHGELLHAQATAFVGDLQQASDLADAAVAVFDELVRHDDKNKEWQLSSANARIDKGNILAARGEWVEATAMAEHSIALLESLVESGTADISVLSHMAEAYQLRSWVQHMTGDATRALVSVQSALSGLQQIELSSRLNDIHIGQRGSLQVLRGELLKSLGREREAESAWRLAAELLQPKAGATRSHVILDPWVRVLMFSGESKRASQLIGELDASGYRPLRPWPG